MAEINEFGYSRENYTEVLNDIVKPLFRAEFGQDIALDDSDPAGQFAVIQSKLYTDTLALLEGMWNARKISGAEGIYLDDIFGLKGVYRKGKQKGTGNIILEVDATADSTYIFPTTTEIAASNGKKYFATENTLLIDNVSSFRLDRADIQIGVEYNVVLTDTTDGVQYPWTYTASDDADRDVFLNALYSFWVEHVDNSTQIFIQDGVLYVGYNSTTLEVQAIDIPTYFYIEPEVGVRHAAVPVECEEAGYFPVAINEVTSINPTFTGFLSVSNSNAFYPWDDVESDAAYRTRYYTVIQETNSGNRDSVVTAILETPSVEKVKIYDNPTNIDRVEADANTFKAVVYGGTSPEVAKAIYDSKPINTGTSGTTSEPVATLDNDSETIYYQAATETPISLRVKYKTKDSVPLSSAEEGFISTALTSYIEVIDIAETLYQTQLGHQVLMSDGGSRLTYLEVEIKAESDVVDNYSTNDYEVNYDSVITLTSDQVFFQRELN